jgi:hypothetical protein
VGGKEKEMVIFRGGHNGRRSEEWIGKCVEFARKALGVEAVGGEIGERQERIEHAASFGELMEWTE